MALMVLVYDSQMFHPLEMEDRNSGGGSNSYNPPGHHLHQVSQRLEHSRPSGHRCGIVNGQLRFVFYKYGEHLYQQPS